MEQIVFSPELCKEKHIQVNDKLHTQEKQIELLVKSDATNTANIRLLLKAVWGLFGTVLVTLFSFLIWYIQRL